MLRTLGSKSCVAYEQRRIDTNSGYGSYWGTYPSSFGVNSATARQVSTFEGLNLHGLKQKLIIFKDCLDSCLQDPQCNYALVDLGAGLCWKIENPLGFKSDEPGFVAYQCGFGLSEWYTHAILILSFCLNFLLQSRLRRFLFDSAKFISAPTKVRPRLATNTLA